MIRHNNCNTLNVRNNFAGYIKIPQTDERLSLRIYNLGLGHHLINRSNKHNIRTELNRMLALVVLSIDLIT